LTVEISSIRNKETPREKMLGLYLFFYAKLGPLKAVKRKKGWKVASVIPFVGLTFIREMG
jgi:hypothetical protein